MKRISGKLEEVLGYYKQMLPKEWGYYSIATMHEVIAIAREHEQLQGRRATETWRNPGWEEREEETRS